MYALQNPCGSSRVLSFAWVGLHSLGTILTVQKHARPALCPLWFARPRARSPMNQLTTIGDLRSNSGQTSQPQLEPHGLHITTTAPINPHYVVAGSIPSTSAPGFATLEASFYAGYTPEQLNLQAGHHLPTTPGGTLINYPLSAYDRANELAKEERRKRNTAASARFRQKKKQKEEATEVRMAAVQEQNERLERRVEQLELENRWLKELITDKDSRAASGGNAGDEDDDEMGDVGTLSRSISRASGMAGSQDS
jgi:hypothetical protein